jgi:ABC-2 type transport system ATP-binding protein
MSSAVTVDGLEKACGEVKAVRGVSFSIETGEIFGLLGPNGAGKTTTVEILEGYRTRDAGRVEVLGADPATAGADWRERIGVVLQSGSLYAQLTVLEILRLFGGYYERARDVDEVIGIVGLEAKRSQRVHTLSGGQKRRLDLGLALVGDPELVFLDEPTTGFDPEARRRALDTIRSLRDLGKTILLTTHYLDEADHLADRLAIVDHGRVVVEGTPDELKGTLHGDGVVVEVTDQAAGGKAAVRLSRIPGLDEVTHDGRVVRARSRSAGGVIPGVLAALEQAGIEVASATVSRPSLDDVYLHYAGRTFEVEPRGSRTKSGVLEEGNR